MDKNRLRKNHLEFGWCFQSFSCIVSFKANWNWYTRNREPGSHFFPWKIWKCCFYLPVWKPKREVNESKLNLSCIVPRGVFHLELWWFPFLLLEAGHKRADFEMLKNSQSQISASLSSEHVILKSLCQRVL